MERLWLSLLLFLILAPAHALSQDSSKYSRKSASPPTGALSAPARQDQGLLKTAGTLKIVELPPQAIPLWRPFRDLRPTLVLLSSDLFMLEVPQDLIPQTRSLVEEGTFEDFHAKARRQIAAPLLLPQQTLSAALNSDFFSQILWVFPPAEEAGMTLKQFREHLVQTGIMSGEEAANLSEDQGVFKGSLQGIPFQTPAINNLPKLDGPVVLHMDLNFFAAQYRNEVATPLFSMLQGTLLALRRTEWPLLLATLSSSTEEGEVPLEARFLKDALAEVFANPARLDTPLPEEWALRRQARHLETFFQPEAIADNYLRMESLQPKDASVKFDLYRAFIMLGDREKALSYLKDAVRLDNGYGREYVNLGLSALQKGSRADALRFFEKALEALPWNPFLTIETVNILIELGERKKAEILLGRLENNSWSKIYYPEIPDYLKELRVQIRSQSR